MAFSAEHYLYNKREGDGLYSESYENVAVLFASIPDFMDAFTEYEEDSIGHGNDGGSECLDALNEIIASFDKVR